jgi:hypothetical protein
MIATAMVIVTVTVLIIIILGLGGIMASIVKKMMKEIGIRLCLGVDRELVRLETKPPPFSWTPDCLVC